MNDKNERPAQETIVIEGTVIAKLLEFGQIAVRADDKSMWALTNHLRDFTMEAWSEGQRVRCTVTKHPALVLSAEVIEPPYCAKLAGPCPDGCASVKLVGCGGGTAGDCWRVKREAALSELSRLSDEIGQELDEPERKD